MTSVYNKMFGMMNPGLFFHNGFKKPKYRTHFTPEEDEKLKELVHRHGTNSWIVVAANLPSRTARQCRERYNMYLSPNVDKSPWTSEEDRLLLRKVQEFGSKWAKIRGWFGNRTVNNIKNRWNTVIRRLRAKRNDLSFEEEFLRSAQLARDNESTRLHSSDLEQINIIENECDHLDPSGFFSVQNLLN